MTETKRVWFFFRQTAVPPENFTEALPTGTQHTKQHVSAVVVSFRCSGFNLLPIH